MNKKFINDDIEKKIGTKNKFISLLQSSNESIAVSFVNPFSYQLITKQKKLIDNIDYLFSDGALLCALSNLRRKQKIDRVSFDFSSIADDVFSFASSENKSVALIGGNKAEIQSTAKYIRNRYPELKLSYFRDGYFSEEEFQSVIHEIDKSNVDIVIAGMGTPLQDEFVVSIKEYSKSAQLSFTCGGFLTQTSLKGDYYHPVIKKLGLRWLQRCIMHKHVRSRLLKDYPIFLLSYLFNKKFN
jgi:exopolysaccharide biosynthesis WecB/TagA/CpsF family protein